jgi:hypothetical protein
MIGCVEDPLEYTHRMLAAVRPGGVLLFNAPNVEACWMNSQLWLDSAPPPDLVTLYRKGFWVQRFSHIAEVEERVEVQPPEMALALQMKRWRHLRWKMPKPEPLVGRLAPMSNDKSKHPALGRLLVSRASLNLRRFAALLGAAKLIPYFPTDFGLFVRMTKK